MPVSSEMISSGFIPLITAACLNIILASAVRPCDTSHLGLSGTQYMPITALAKQGIAHRTTNMRQDAPLPMVKKAKTGTPMDPAVQKYSIYMRYLPLASVGRNSANTSNGTVRPPTPKPTMNLVTKRPTNSVVKAVATPKTLIRNAHMMKTGFRPILSPRAPQTSVPVSDPAKTHEVMDAVCSPLSPHSASSIPDRKLRSMISMESAMKQRPAATSSVRWNRPVPIESMALSMEISVATFGATAAEGLKVASSAPWLFIAALLSAWFRSLERSTERSLSSDVGKTSSYPPRAPKTAGVILASRPCFTAVSSLS
mmetsp:Transcript_52985/g.158596  ORF Transcript_52985/g.158596 Transcript_52985/m.158596 type:complete len:313 (+) Transcript_52985:749-1687(+)